MTDNLRNDAIDFIAEARRKHGCTMHELAEVVASAITRMKQAVLTQIATGSVALAPGIVKYGGVTNATEYLLGSEIQE